MPTLNGTTGPDTLIGGAGNDTIDGLEGNDRLFGRGGDDELIGFLGRDKLYGGGGNDVLVAEDGRDEVYGGGGDDLILVARIDLVAGEVYDGGTGIDTLNQAGYSTGIFDYRDITLAGLEYFEVRHGQDLTIHFDAAHFIAGNFLQPEAGMEFGTFSDMNSFEVLIHMGDARALNLGDLSVSINLKADEAATFTILGSVAADRIVASEGDGDWIVRAGGGADIINMRFNGDAYGGLGNDVIRNVGAGNTAFGQAGQDTLLLNGKYASGYGGGGADRIVLNGFNSEAWGGGGNDTLILADEAVNGHGGSGDDTFLVRALSGDLQGDDGYDILNFSSFAFQNFQAVRIDGPDGTYSFLDGFDTTEAADFGGFEEIIGTDGNDLFFGGDDSMILRGGGGNDAYYGGNGANTVFGGDGFDRLRMKNSEDVLFGGRGADSFEAIGASYTGGGAFHGGKGRDELGFTAKLSSYAFDMRDAVIKSVEVLSLSFAGVNNNGTIILNAQQFGRGLALDGEIDMLNVLGARMTLNVHMNGRAALDLSDLTFTHDNDLHEVQMTGTEDGESMTGGVLIRNDIMAGGGADDLTGGRKADYLFGEGGRDNLSGRGGGDWIEGGMGRDVMAGGGGADSFIFLSANESRTGATRRDVITDFNTTFDQISVSGFGTDFIGTAAFSGSSGEIRAVLTGNGLNTRILIDEDGDSVADFELLLLGVTSFTEVNLDAPA